MKYKQLDYLQRCKILAFWKAGYNRTKIAKEIGVHKSTTSRELNKNLTLEPVPFAPIFTEVHMPICDKSAIVALSQ